MPVERSAQLNLLLLYLDRRTLRLRIHGRPRSDRKRRFLLSAVVPSTSARHPRKARPINWAQCGGPVSGREMSPDAEATFHRASCTLANQVVRASDGSLFHQERRPTHVCRTPGAGSDLIAEPSTLQRAPRPTAHCPRPRHRLHAAFVCIRSRKYSATSWFIGLGAAEDRNGQGERRCRGYGKRCSMSRSPHPSRPPGP
jgi:hypothetical protein